MNSETGNAFEAEYHDRVLKIRKAAALALKELDQLRSGGPMTALDAEVARIAREKLQPYGWRRAFRNQSSAHREKLRSDRTFLLS